MERRYENSALAPVIEERAEGSKGPGKISGYASLYNSPYDMGWFTEVIARGAFKDVLNDDVRALFNHDSNLILGRSKAGTLKIEEDDMGLKYTIDLPDTQLGRDLAESVRRGDINQSSFAFSIEAEEWTGLDAQGGKTVRTITKMKGLYDVSPVTYPANPDTTVAKRSAELNKPAEPVKPLTLDFFKLKLELIRK